MATLQLSNKPKIVGGPSREELFDALRLLGEERTVTFDMAPKIGPKETHRFAVIGISAENGGGHSWIVAGWFLGDVEHHDTVELHYDDQRRSGHVGEGRPMSQRLIFDEAKQHIMRGGRRVARVVPRIAL